MKSQSALLEELVTALLDHSTTFQCSDLGLRIGGITACDIYFFVFSVFQSTVILHVAIVPQYHVHVDYIIPRM